MAEKKNKGSQIPKHEQGEYIRESGNSIHKRNNGSDGRTTTTGQVSPPGHKK